MLTEEQKRRIESLYNTYYRSAFNSHLEKDMQSFYMGKYMGIGDVLAILDYSLESAYEIVSNSPLPSTKEV